MSTALPLDALDLDQPEVGLVDQRGGLKRVIGPLAAHVTGGQATELLMDERKQLIQGRFVTPAPSLQQRRWVAGVTGNAPILHAVDRFASRFRLWR